MGLSLENGIPSHDTFGRVFARLDPAAFSACFVAWTQALQKATGGQIVALDGKKLRHSFDTATGQEAIHMVSAWASASALVLAQPKVQDKSNEISAIAVVLRLLDITGCTITIDAMGCQKQIAEQIVAQGGDYVLALKDNHPRLHDEVRRLFAWARSKEAHDIALAFAETRSYGHGRQERRRCWVTSDLAWLDETDAPRAWAGLKSVALVESERRLGEQISLETRYFISSLPARPGRILRTVRQHWHIENRLHWVLDVAFGEDACRVRKDRAPENLAIVRHLALNLLRQQTQDMAGIKARRLRAAWDSDYLLQILAG